MTRLVARRTISASPRAVFEAVADVKNLPRKGLDKHLDAVKQDCERTAEP